MKWRVSTYWKCQLIGWGIVSLFVLVVNITANKTEAAGWIWRSNMIFLFGIVFTHLERFLIKRLKIFDRKFSLQVVYLLLLDGAFALITTALFMSVLYVSGILKMNVGKSVPSYLLFGLYTFAFYQVLIITIGWVAIYFLVHYIRGIKNAEREKAALKIKLIEAEAQSLRAQMNPHFIFNCMNSIKALIQQKEEEKAILYLTTFSKLIRTLFQNSDKRQISLYDEIETCKLYTQLESMRLDEKLKYAFCIDPNVDLRSVMVPALILQPFIENAIWHGIVPKESGAVNISVTGNGEAIICEVDDDGIGRETSKLNKPVTPIIHESKGVHLSQQRLNLEKILNDTNASIEIIDKYEDRTPIGTKVILSFNLN